MFCYKCGAQIDDEAVVCPKCGCATKNYKGSGHSGPCSSKSRLVALLLAVFLGWIGVHRFYAGKIGTGVVWLLTGGCLGVGWIIDVILIACGTFKDGQGQPITEWET